MRTIRIWLLLLLAVLVPLRGAVAAALLCPAAGVGSQSEVRMGDQPIGHHAATEPVAAVDDHAQHGHAHHDHGHAGHDHGAQDKCNLCSAFCSVTPIVGTSPPLAARLDLTSASFPDLTAPAASFLSSGQERPPRSI